MRFNPSWHTIQPVDVIPRDNQTIGLIKIDETAKRTIGGFLLQAGSTFPYVWQSQDQISATLQQSLLWIGEQVASMQPFVMDTTVGASPDSAYHLSVSVDPANKAHYTIALTTPAGGGSGSNALDVMLAPTASTRNIVQPTGAFPGIELRGTSEQLRLGYDATNVAKFAVDSTGQLNLDTYGHRLIVKAATGDSWLEVRQDTDIGNNAIIIGADPYHAAVYGTLPINFTPSNQFDADLEIDANGGVLYLNFDNDLGWAVITTPFGGPIIFDSYANQQVRFSAAVQVGIGAAAPTGVRLYLNTVASGNKGLLIRMVASPTALPFEIQSSASATLASIDQTGLGAFAGLSITDAKNIALGTGTGTKIGTAANQKLGLWGKAGVVQPVLAAYTADPESVAYTGQASGVAGTTYAKVADLNALRVAYENLRAGYEDHRTKMQSWALG